MIKLKVQRTVWYGDFVRAKIRYWIKPCRSSTLEGEFRSSYAFWDFDYNRYMDNAGRERSEPGYKRFPRELVWGEDRFLGLVH